MRVERAGVGDADTVASLYSAYCGFYGSRVSDADAGAFVRERLDRDEAVVFVAFLDDRAEGAGFTLLYPKFSSTRLRRDWILNDLFVMPDARRSGIAKALLRAAADFVESSGSRVVALKTQVDNTPARSLYERMGWRLDEMFVTYVLDLDARAKGF